MRAGNFLGETYQKQSEHQQSYNNFNNDKFVLLIKKFFLGLNHPLSIGDLGCGHGVPSIDLAQKLQELKDNGILIKEIIGYDISASQIEQANQLKRKFAEHRELFFYQQDIQSLPDQKRFDALLCWFGLNWMDNIIAARDSIYQALKPGGIFVFLIPLEKPTLFNLRKKLLASPKWAEKFSGYKLEPFIHYNKSYVTTEKGYEDIFSEKFVLDHASSYRGRGIRIFQTADEFINFLKSWIQELRAEKNSKRVLDEKEQDEYVKELVESIQHLRYDQDADVNPLPDGRIEFHEEYIFACWHKPPDATFKFGLNIGEAQQEDVGLRGP